MGRRIGTPWPALVLAAITTALMIASGPISRLARHSSDVALVVVLVGFLVVGLILVRNRPRNPIAWSMLLAAFFGSVPAVAGSSAVRAFRPPHALPVPPR